MDLEFLYKPVEDVDQSLSALFDGAPLLVALGIALALGLRHASDPDHLVAVTSLVAAEDRGPRDATRLGFWWGLGHAICLLLIGFPLIAFKSSLPPWLESGAEKAVGVVIVLLALRVIRKWARGEQRHGHHRVRTPRRAFGIGLLHGLAGTGAVVVLLLAALPTRLDAALGLAVFAPMTIFSMAACTTAFAWVLTRPLIEPVYRTVLVPAMGLFGLTFGLWYVGLA
jgi:hypothetical protein